MDAFDLFLHENWLAVGGPYHGEDAYEQTNPTIPGRWRAAGYTFDSIRTSLGNVLYARHESLSSEAAELALIGIREEFNKGLRHERISR